DKTLLRGEIRAVVGGHVDDFLRGRLSPRLVKYLDATIIELQLDPRVWGIQERVAKRLGRSKSRVSEALAAIRHIARDHEIESLREDGIDAEIVGLSVPAPHNRSGL